MLQTITHTVAQKLAQSTGLIASGLLLVAGATVLFAWHTQSVRLLTVNSASMSPGISTGDAVVVRKVQALDIKKGDIVSYPSPRDSQVIITHRVVETNPLTGQLITKGDANAGVDPTVHAVRVLGKVDHVLPGAGVYINALRSWQGLVAVVYIPTAILVCLELRRLAHYYLRPTYVLRHGRYS